MIGLGKSRTNKWILLGFVLLCLCFVFVSVEGSYKYHKRFAKHLLKFMKKEKHYITKGLALAAMAGLSKKKVVSN